MIYLDHAAATPLSRLARRAMEPFFSDQFFNPSAAYLPAQQIHEIYEDAKSRLARLIGAKGGDLVITSGATESINLAFSLKPKHCLVLATEHAAVQAAAAPFSPKTIKVDRFGVIDLENFRTQLNSNTELISISVANNELGTIQPLAEIAQMIRQEKLRRQKQGLTTPLYFHTDASQGFNLLKLNVAKFNIDLLTLNAAKMYGPKGIGALYVSRDIKLQPLILGGGQERGLRSGTENVPAMMGFAAAAEDIIKHQDSNQQTYLKFKQIFQDELKSLYPAPVFLGNPKCQLANFCPLCFPDLDAERLIYKLEEHAVYVSTGAACAASKGEPSHVLQAIGLSSQEIAGSLRVSFGALNNATNVKKAARIIRQVVTEERVRL